MDVTAGGGGRGNGMVGVICGDGGVCGGEGNDIGLVL